MKFFSESVDQKHSYKTFLYILFLGECYK